ncbi:MAG: cbb3-type cytochrome c oxidase N-terminal domain-containing protein [Runella sp.]
MTKPIESQELFLLVVLIAVAFGTLALLAVTIQLYFTLKRITSPAQETTSQPRRSWWDRFIDLKPLSQEKDLQMAHAYDGIRELKNSTPPWFMFLFYGTIVFSVIYGIIYHVIGDGQTMLNEYNQEVAIAEKVREDYLKKAANAINENNVTLLTDANALAEGQKVYTQSCAACHGQKGEGGVGPNLTDPYWLHGGSLKEVFHTITEGVPEKGMIAWKSSLNPLQIQRVSSFILTLQGTNPPNAKEPQGTLVKNENTTEGKETAMNQ